MKLALRRLSSASPGARDARRSWPVRQRLLLRLTDDAGRTGFGEASPLPGYSPESLNDVEAALAAVDVTSLQARASIREALASAAALLPLSLPSARFALETALLDLLGKQRGASAPTLLGAAPLTSRPLSALLGPATDATLLEDADRAVSAGYRCLKLKLGAPGALTAELAAAKRLRERIGSGVGLRLDANGALGPEELESGAATLLALGVELFEEPGAPLPGGVPLALDESLQGLAPDDAEALWQRRAAHGIVLKPTCVGGFDHCLALAERALASGLRVVISHAFEGEIAWRAAAALALALPDRAAHGLAPHPGLGDPAALGLPLHAGSLRGWTAPGLGTMSPPDFG